MGKYSVEIRQVPDGFGLFMEGEALATPDERPLVSKHEDLVAEIRREIESTGDVVCRTVSMYTLHGAYLDADRADPGALARTAMGLLRRDWFFERPADPAFLFPIMSMLGTIDVSRDELLPALNQLRPRQLVSILGVANGLGSMLLGFKTVTAVAPLPPLSMGSCQRYVSHLFSRTTEELDGFAFGGGCDGRTVPADADEQFCSKCYRAKELSPEFVTRCAVHRALDKARRFAAIPEE